METDRHLLVNVSEAIQDFPEESPEPVLVLMQPVIYGVPQSAFFTVFHLSEHRAYEWDAKQGARQTSIGRKEVLHHIVLAEECINTFLVSVSTQNTFTEAQKALPIPLTCMYR